MAFGVQQTFSEQARLAGAGRVWNDWAFRAIVLNLPAIADPDYKKYRDNGAGSRGVWGWHFASGEVGTHASEQLPHGYVPGTDLADPHVHFLFQAAPVAGKTIIWTAEVEVTPLGGSCPLTTLFTGTYTIPSGLAQWADVYLPLDGGLATVYPGAGLTISSTGSCTIERGGDYAAEVVYKGFDFHVLCDSLGSDTERTKSY